MPTHDGVLTIQKMFTPGGPRIAPWSRYTTGAMINSRSGLPLPADASTTSTGFDWAVVYGSLIWKDH